MALTEPFLERVHHKREADRQEGQEAEDKVEVAALARAWPALCLDTAAPTKDEGCAHAGARKVDWSEQCWREASKRSKIMSSARVESLYLAAVTRFLSGRYTLPETRLKKICIWQS